MDSHTGLLAMSKEEFEKSAMQLEAAFAENRAAFVWDDKSASQAIYVFDRGNVNADDWEALGRIANSMGQMLVYAFEDAPDKVVRRWGEEHIEGSGDVAVARVRYLSDELREVRREWEDKFTGLGRTLGSVNLSVVYSVDVTDFRLILRADSFDVTGKRKSPVSASRQYFEAVLTRRDVLRLIVQLNQAEASMPDAQELLSEEGFNE